MAFTVVSVTASFTDQSANAASGQIDFLLTEPISNGGVTVDPVVLSVTLDGSGSLSVSLVANDDTGTLPAGSGYTVTERIVGAEDREYTISVPSGLGGTVTLASLMPGTPGWS